MNEPHRAEQRDSYLSPDGRTRWLAVQNFSGEEIPGFGLIRLDVEADAFINQVDEDQQAVWKAYKPNADAEGRQNPAMLMVNGPSPIPAGSYGQATQDWPAQVLHDGGNDSLPNGFPCGPQADSWYVWRGGSAFTNITHDITRAIPGAESHIHTVWISAGNGDNQGSQIAVTGGSTTVAAGDKIPLFGSTVAEGAELLGTNDGVKITRAGIWQISASATLSSTVAPRGAILRMRLYNGASATSFLGYRLNDIEEDEYGADILFTAENVCFPALLDLEKDDELFLKNDASYECAYANVIFTAHRLSSPFAEPSGSLNYP